MNLLKEYCRMCHEYYSCSKCPISVLKKDSLCQEWMLNNFDQATEIITKWAQEHPQKTRQDVFLERYPKAMVDRDGLICIDPCNIEQGLKKMDCRDYFLNCTNCRRNYWLAPAEEEE